MGLPFNTLICPQKPVLRGDIRKVKMVCWNGCTYLYISGPKLLQQQCMGESVVVLWWYARMCEFCLTQSFNLPVKTGSYVIL